VHALRFGDAVYDVANALRKHFLCGRAKWIRSNLSAKRSGA